MFLTLKSFSQIVTQTQQIPNNDTVKIHINVAKKIAKDLLYLDALKQERLLLLENIDTITFQKVMKDSIISKKDDQIGLYKANIELYKEKESLYSKSLNLLQADLAKQKIRNKLSFLSIAALAIYIFVHK
jgi:hypothetical protein